MVMRELETNGWALRFNSGNERAIFPPAHVVDYGSQPRSGG